MSEKWSIEQLFEDENGGNPFSRGPEEMLLWECHGNDSAFVIWRGYDPHLLQDVINRQLALHTSTSNVTYCVEFPSRKGHRDRTFVEKRKFTGGAKCLPDSSQRFLITLIENKWGATLNDQTYMATKGKRMDFYMRTDTTKETVFSFDNWDDVKKMAYTTEV